MWEKARNTDGSLTHWVTGRRYVFIDLPTVHLPPKITVCGSFQASLYYREQPKPVIRCFACHCEGHRRGDPVCKGPQSSRGGNPWTINLQHGSTNQVNESNLGDDRQEDLVSDEGSQSDDYVTQSDEEEVSQQTEEKEGHSFTREEAKTSKQGKHDISEIKCSLDSERKMGNGSLSHTEKENGQEWVQVKKTKNINKKAHKEHQAGESGSKKHSHLGKPKQAKLADMILSRSRSGSIKRTRSSSPDPDAQHPPREKINATGRQGRTHKSNR